MGYELSRLLMGKRIKCWKIGKPCFNAPTGEVSSIETRYPRSGGRAKIRFKLDGRMNAVSLTYKQLGQLVALGCIYTKTHYIEFPNDGDYDGI